jgi:hypothetical protein
LEEKGDPETQRKACYVRPRLVCFGSLHEMTKNNTPNDGPDNSTFS